MLSINPNESKINMSNLLDEHFNLCDWFPAFIIDKATWGGPVPVENESLLICNQPYYVRIKMRI